VPGKNHRPKKKPTVSVKNRGRSITIPCAACGQEFVVYVNESVRVCREHILSHYSDKEVPNA
jgi:transcription elongation factor Elf1